MIVGKAFRARFRTRIGTGKRSNKVVENLALKTKGLGQDAIKFSKNAIDIAADPVTTTTGKHLAGISANPVSDISKLAQIKIYAVELEKRARYRLELHHEDPLRRLTLSAEGYHLEAVANKLSPEVRKLLDNTLLQSFAGVEKAQYIPAVDLLRGFFYCGPYDMHRHLGAALKNEVKGWTIIRDAADKLLAIVGQAA